MSLRAFCVLTLSAFLGVGNAAGQSTTTTATRGFEFLPAGTLFPPLVAHAQEPRVGVRKEIGTSRLKLDIGSSVDLLQYNADELGKARFRFGADFFTYALTTSAEGLRLQVDAVDGFFGGHILFQLDNTSSVLTLRLRLMHLSAHLIDGHYDIHAGMWKDNRLPIPFTRDFGELVAAYTWWVGGMPVMLYSGIDYATLVRPSDVQRLASLHGFQFNTGNSLGDVFGKPFLIYVADNLSLTGVPVYVGTNVAEAGVKFGAWNSTGIRFYVNYASGMQFFSQYYNERRDMGGVGFAFDFW